MKVLVIPDVHLKPWIFDQAFEIMENTDCELAVCLGDLVDDWRHGSRYGNEDLCWVDTVTGEWGIL